MKSEFDAAFFAGNRKKLRDLSSGDAPIVLTANGQLQRSGDSTYPFQQDASFWYLTNINDPDMMLVLNSSDEYIILPKRSGYQDAFDGEIDAAELSKKSGIQNILEYEQGWEKLTATLKKSKQVATIAVPPEYIDVYGMYTNPARRKLVEKIKKENDAVEFLDVSEYLTQQRVVKQPVELEAIRQAIAITLDGLERVLNPEAIKKYTYEYEAEADLTRAFRLQGSQHAFDPIIAGGSRACTLHNTGMNCRISADELLLFDVGAMYEGYAADITRTAAINTPSPRQQAVFDAVKDVQAYAYTILKPGVLLKDYEEQIERCMGEKLIELGLIKSNDTESVRKYYPHATSHHLGLNVHDVGDRSASLEPGMVITVEPGVYIQEEGIGVRIEDDVVVTKNGIEVLSDALPAVLK